MSGEGPQKVGLSPQSCERLGAHSTTANEEGLKEQAGGPTTGAVLGQRPI